jgi:hypothetical protein
MNYKYKH